MNNQLKITLAAEYGRNCKWGYRPDNVSWEQAGSRILVGDHEIELAQYGAGMPCWADDLLAHLEKFVADGNVNADAVAEKARELIAGYKAARVGRLEGRFKKIGQKRDMNICLGFCLNEVGRQVRAGDYGLSFGRLDISLPAVAGKIVDLVEVDGETDDKDFLLMAKQIVADGGQLGTGWAEYAQKFGQEARESAYRSENQIEEFFNFFYPAEKVFSLQNGKEVQVEIEPSGLVSCDMVAANLTGPEIDELNRLLVQSGLRKVGQ